MNLIRILLAIAMVAIVAGFVAQVDHSHPRGIAARYRLLLSNLSTEFGKVSLKEKITERAGLWDQMKTLMTEAEGRSMTAEEIGKYEALETDLDKRDKEIAVEERHAKLAERYDKVETDPIVNPGNEERDGDDRDAYVDAFEAYVVRGMADLEPEQRKVLRSGWQPGKEGRAQSVGTTTAGGYLVPEGFRQKIVETMKAYGAVQDVAEVINTATGNTLPWPTNDDTGNVGALLAENTQATEQDIVIGTNDLGVYKYTSKVIRASIEFLQDVDWLDAESFLRRKFAERLGRIHNQHLTTGTGTNQPLGIVTGATSGVTAAGVAAITADELIDLEHSVDPAYRNENSKFMFSDTALKIVRKLKAAGTGEYLWQPSVQAGVASLYNGYRYVINNDMAVPATGVKSVLFGDFRAGYVVRLVKAFQLIRMDERWADFGQVGFVAFDRMDGTVQDTSAYKALTQA